MCTACSIVFTILEYSKELRERFVAAAVQGECTTAEIPNALSLGVTFVKTMLNEMAPLTASLPTIWRALHELNPPEKKASPQISVTKKNSASFRRPSVVTFANSSSLTKLPGILP